MDYRRLTRALIAEVRALRASVTDLLAAQAEQGAALEALSWQADVLRRRLARADDFAGYLEERSAARARSCARDLRAAQEEADATRYREYEHRQAVEDLERAQRRGDDYGIRRATERLRRGY